MKEHTFETTFFLLRPRSDLSTAASGAWQQPQMLRGATLSPCRSVQILEQPRPRTWDLNKSQVKCVP